MMKQAYFFLAIILMGGFASAQITLNTSAWPSPGSDFSFSFDNSSHPDSTILNATGANQSWDFSTLTPFGNYSETYFDISNSPHQNDHPDADFWKLECAPCGGTGPDTLFYYYLSDVNGFYKTEVGVVLNGTYITFPFASPDTLITSLFTFGSNHTYYSDWYGIGQPMDTLHAERTWRTVEVNGWGDFVLDVNTHQALRAKVTEIVQMADPDSLNQLTWDIPDTTNYYSWIGNFYDYFYAQVFMSPDWTTPYNTQVRTTLPVGREEVIENQLFLTLFPNPAEELVSLQFPNANDFRSIEILDMVGKVLLKTQRHQSFKDIGKAQLNLSQIPSGIYLVRVNYGEQSLTEKLIVE